MIVLMKNLTLIFSVLIVFTACNTNESYTYWTDRTDNQIQRLDEAKIEYEVREDEIWVREKALEKVVACCS